MSEQSQNLPTEIQKKESIQLPNGVRPFSRFDLEEINRSQLERAKIDPTINYGTAHSFRHLTEKDQKSYETGEMQYNLYALPEVDSMTPKEFLQILPDESFVLDVACGEGAFGKGLKNLRPDINIFGIDINTFEDVDIDEPKENQSHVPNEAYSGFLQSSVDDVNISELIKSARVEKFNLIVMSAIYHHLHDPYSAVRKYANFLDSDSGVLMVTMLSRVVDYGEEREEVNYGIKRMTRDFEVNDDSEGKWPDTRYGVTNGDKQTIIHSDGSIVQPKDFFYFLQQQNPGFEINYSLVDVDRLERQDLAGRLTIRRNSDEEFVIKGLFYAFDDNEEINIFILAKDEDERQKLLDKGYTEV